MHCSAQLLRAFRLSLMSQVKGGTLSGETLKIPFSTAGAAPPNPLRGLPLINRANLTTDNTRDLRAVLKAEGQRQAHVENTAQNPVTLGHPLRRGITPTVIAAGEPRRLRPTEPLQFHTPFQTARDDLANRAIFPIQKQKLDGRTHESFLFGPLHHLQAGRA